MRWWRLNVVQNHVARERSTWVVCVATFVAPLRNHRSVSLFSRICTEPEIFVPNALFEKLIQSPSGNHPLHLSGTNRLSVTVVGSPCMTRSIVKSLCFVHPPVRTFTEIVSSDCLTGSGFRSSDNAARRAHAQQNPITNALSPPLRR